MRLGALAFVATLLLLASPPATATATPVLVWPDPGFADRSEADNLTLWLADRLNESVDETRAPFWYPLEDPRTHPGCPVSPGAVEAYALPLVRGEIRASYLASGRLAHASFEGNTSFVAASTREEDLEAVVRTVATAVGFDAGSASAFVILEVYNAGLPSEERMWEVGLTATEDIGGAPLWNRFVATVADGVPGWEPDLMVVSVQMWPWYKSSGSPDVPAAQAAAIMVEDARTRFGAQDPVAEVTRATVRNGTDFDYDVSVSWSAGPSQTWVYGATVDANTGEVLCRSEPGIVVESQAVLPLPWGAIGLATVAVALLAGLLFFRMTADRALDHFTRGRILGFLQANPGTPYAHLRGALGVRNGTLAYHLWVLERTGFVRSVRDGRHRILYPDGAPVQHGLLLSRLQLTILDTLHAHGGMTQADLGRRLGISRQRLHYNVKMLRKNVLVETPARGTVRLSSTGTALVMETANPPEPQTPAAG